MRLYLPKHGQRPVSITAGYRGTDDGKPTIIKEIKMKNYTVTIRFTTINGMEVAQYSTADICVDEYNDINGALDAADVFAQSLVDNEYNDYVEYEIVSIVI